MTNSPGQPVPPVPDPARPPASGPAAGPEPRFAGAPIPRQGAPDGWAPPAVYAPGPRPNQAGQPAPGFPPPPGAPPGREGNPAGPPVAGDGRPPEPRPPAAGAPARRRFPLWALLVAIIVGLGLIGLAGVWAFSALVPSIVSTSASPTTTRPAPTSTWPSPTYAVKVPPAGTTKAVREVKLPTSVAGYSQAGAASGPRGPVLAQAAYTQGAVTLTASAIEDVTVAAQSATLQGIADGPNYRCGLVGGSIPTCWSDARGGAVQVSAANGTASVADAAAFMATLLTRL